MQKIYLTLALLIILVIGHSQTNNEEQAIKALLEKESATWRAKDVVGHAACWQVRPYSRILVSTGNGQVIDVPPIAMVQTKPENMGDGGISINSNYTFSIQQNTAWVSHEELSISATGKQTKTFEIRLLEKVDGEWKLVGQSIMVQQTSKP